MDNEGLKFKKNKTWNERAAMLGLMACVGVILPEAFKLSSQIAVSNSYIEFDNIDRAVFILGPSLVCYASASLFRSLKSK